ncbi:MAG: methyltransferase type 11, partial [Candidatus Diapherotrites archaeon]|nr:methyltransferase type 11 [Candidatus Diapherotrites archaeon]
RVSKANAVISLPDSSRAYRLSIQLPKTGHIKKIIPVPRICSKKQVFDGQHYWEIGKAGFPLAEIKSAIEKEGFEIERTYRVFENPYHRFFVLKKAGQ